MDQAKLHPLSDALHGAPKCLHTLDAGLIIYMQILAGNDEWGEEKGGRVTWMNSMSGCTTQSDATTGTKGKFLSTCVQQMMVL